MKKFILIMVILSNVGGILAGNAKGIEGYGSTPLQVLDSIVDKSNEDYKIQETKLDDITKDKGAFSNENRISNTLDDIRQEISPYLQWLVFIGLTLAVILLIINGWKLVFTPLEGDQLSSVKTNIINITLGILILLGFYYIIQIALSIVGNFLA